jgi:hypothetical protein
MLEDCSILFEGVKVQYAKFASGIKFYLTDVLPSTLKELICDMLRPDFCLLTSLCQVDHVVFDLGPNAICREHIEATKQGKQWKIQRFPYEGFKLPVFSRIKEIVLDVLDLFRLFMGENRIAERNLCGVLEHDLGLLRVLLDGLAQSFDLA